MMNNTYTNYTRQNAYAALPYLIHFAQSRKTTTYKQISGKIGLHHRATRHFLGCIRDEICIPRGLPLINAIVVNANTGLPGEGWLPQGTSHLTEAEYSREFEKFRDQVFSYLGWDTLLQELGLQPVSMSEDELEEQGRRRSLYLERAGRVGEGDYHRELKEWIAKNPETLSLSSVLLGEMEHLFISGDRCDVLFDLGKDGHAIVEVKRNEPGELTRGIYQLIKYRALLEAEMGKGRHYPTKTFLVAKQIPREIISYARKFGVACRDITFEQGSSTQKSHEIETIR